MLSAVSGVDDQAAAYEATAAGDAGSYEEIAQAYQQEAEAEYADPYQAEYDAELASYYSNVAGVYDEPDYGDVVADSPVAEYADFYSDEIASAEDSLEGQGADAWSDSLASQEEAESTSEMALSEQTAESGVSDAIADASSSSGVDVGSIVDSGQDSSDESGDDSGTTLFDSEDGGAAYTDELLNSFYGGGQSSGEESGADSSNDYSSESTESGSSSDGSDSGSTEAQAEATAAAQTEAQSQTTTQTQTQSGTQTQTGTQTSVADDTNSNTEEAPGAETESATEEQTPDPRFAWEPLSFKATEGSMVSALPGVQNAASNDEDLFSIVPTGTSTFSNVTTTTNTPVVEPTDPELGIGTKTTNGSEEVTLSQTYTSPTNWVVTESVTKTYSTVENSVDNDGANQDFTREGEETFTVTVINGTTTITTYSISDTFSYESGDVAGVTAGSSPASWSVPTEWEDEASTPPDPTVSTDPVPSEGETIVAEEFTPDPDMTDADESEVTSESDSFGARYTTTVSFSVSVIETLITLPDGRSGRTTTVSIGSSNSFVSLANGGYGSSSSEGTLDSVTIDSTMIDNNVVLSTSSTPGGNGHSVSSSGSFISYANASTSFSATATITVADGDSPADAEPSGSANFSTESASGSAASSSLNGSYQSSGAGGFEHVTIESSHATSGNRHFNYSNSATFGPGVSSGGTTSGGGPVASSLVSGGGTGGTGGTSGGGSGCTCSADLDTGSGGGFDSKKQIIIASSQGPGNDPSAQTTTTTVAKIKGAAAGGSSKSRTLDEIDIDGGSSITGNINISTATNYVYQYSPTSIWTIDSGHTFNASMSEASGVKYNLTDNTFDFDPTSSGDISINNTTNYYHELDSWDLDAAGNPVNNSLEKYKVTDSYNLKFEGSETEEPDGHVLHTLYSELETIGGSNPMPQVTHLVTFVNVGLGASAPPPSTRAFNMLAFWH